MDGQSVCGDFDMSEQYDSCLKLLYLRALEE